MSVWEECMGSSSAMKATAITEMPDEGAILDTLVAMK
jgi:hypothetical protein